MHEKHYLVQNFRGVTNNIQPINDASKNIWEINKKYL